VQDSLPSCRYHLEFVKLLYTNGVKRSRRRRLTFGISDGARGCVKLCFALKAVQQGISFLAVVFHWLSGGLVVAVMV
jgi:hypothetical protein